MGLDYVATDTPLYSPQKPGVTSIPSLEKAADTEWLINQWEKLGTKPLLQRRRDAIMHWQLMKFKRFLDGQKHYCPVFFQGKARLNCA